MHTLKQHWNKIHFGEISITTTAKHHEFSVRVYFNVINPDTVKVELFADGMNGKDPIITKMDRGKKVESASNGYIYACLLYTSDIPGIIEGAHEGKGLGLRFLRHIERNSMLLFIVPADSANHLNEYRILLNELEKYNPELLDKQRYLAVSKADLLDEELMKEISKELKGIPHLFFSSLTGLNIPQLKDKIWQILNE